MKVATTNLAGTSDTRCKNCFKKTYRHLFEKFSLTAEQRRIFNLKFRAVFDSASDISSPEIQRILNIEFCRIIGVADPFKNEKVTCNQIALDLYKEWKPKVLASTDPFDLALRLAIAGNIMDYGANNSFDIHQTISLVLETKLAIDHSVKLRDTLKHAKKILYLGDNSGEIVFDKLFIEIMMHHDVTYVVKGGPVLNDATMEDSISVGMELSANVVSNGFDAPSTVLKSSSKEFLAKYDEADVIISKGQGNFEGLVNTHDPRIFYMLMAKCDVIAEWLNVEKGSFVVYNQSEKN